MSGEGGKPCPTPRLRVTTGPNQLSWPHCPDWQLVWRVHANQPGRLHGSEPWKQRSVGGRLGKAFVFLILKRERIHSVGTPPLYLSALYSASCLEHRGIASTWGNEHEERNQHVTEGEAGRREGAGFLAALGSGHLQPGADCQLQTRFLKTKQTHKISTSFIQIIWNQKRFK